MSRAILLLVVMTTLLVAQGASAATPVTLSLSGASVTAVELDWTQSLDLCFVRYDVEYRVAGAAAWDVAANISDASVTATVVTGLQAGTGYEFRVVDVDCVLSTTSNVVSATTGSLTVVAYPTARDTLQVEWTRSTDHCFGHYGVESRPQGLTSWRPGENIANVSITSSTIVGLTEGTTYEVRVKDFDCWGSAPSPMAVATTFLFRPQLASSQMNASVALGSNVTFSLQARNLGNLEDTLTMAASAPPSGWNASFSLPQVTLAVNATAEVMLTVFAPAALGSLRSWTLTVQAIAGDGTATPGINLTVDLAAPDLSIPGPLRIEPSAPQPGASVTVEVLVKNVGSVSATGAVVRMQVGSQVYNATIDVPAGGSRSASFSFQASEGAQIVSVVVDPDGVIPEFNESDNAIEQTVIALLLRPDLSLSTNDLVVEPALPLAGHLVFINVTVHNVGNASCSDALVRLRVDALILARWVNLSAGAQALLSFSFLAVEGSQQVILEADPTGRIPEMDETNNQLSLEVIAAPSLPDLVLSGGGGAANATAPDLGATVNLTVTLWNHGTQDASSVLVQLRVEGTVENQTANVTAGGSAPVTFHVRLLHGSVLAVVEADPRGMIRELDELNNHYEVTLYANGPDLTLDAADIEVPEFVVVEGDRVVVSVTVHNVGIRPAGPFDVFCLIGGKYSGRAALPGLGAVNGTARVNFTWVARSGPYDVEVTLDVGGVVMEVDEQNNRAVASFTVDAKPLARISAPSSAFSGASVLIRGDQSTDADGSVVAFFFDFGDGTNTSWVSSGAVEHSYFGNGTFEVRLWVRDNLGAISNFSAVSLSIADAPPPVEPPNSFSISADLWWLIGLAGVVVLATAVRMAAHGRRSARRAGAATVPRVNPTPATSSQAVPPPDPSPPPAPKEVHVAKPAATPAPSPPIAGRPVPAPAVRDLPPARASISPPPMAKVSTLEEPVLRPVAKIAVRPEAVPPKAVLSDAPAPRLEVHMAPRKVVGRVRDAAQKAAPAVPASAPEEPSAAGGARAHGEPRDGAPGASEGRDDSGSHFIDGRRVPYK